MRLVCISPASGLLHARGGVSRSVGNIHAASSSSPRPWRCFFRGEGLKNRITVFSTPVEVFPGEVLQIGESDSLLHARGGVSLVSRVSSVKVASSPRPWRCFSTGSGAGCWRSVFSTPVEVFLVARRRRRPDRCLLHARGGVSMAHRTSAARSVSSPRPWRCFWCCRGLLGGR